MLLLENNQHQDSNANCASYKAASHHPVVDHFPITAHRQVCYPVLYKISPGCKVERDRIRNLFETHTSLSCFLLHHLICMMNCKWKLIGPCARWSNVLVCLEAWQIETNSFNMHHLGHRDWPLHLSSQFYQVHLTSLMFSVTFWMSDLKKGILNVCPRKIWHRPRWMIFKNFSILY